MRERLIVTVTEGIITLNKLIKTELSSTFTNCNHNHNSFGLLWGQQNMVVKTIELSNTYQLKW